ncbi:MAG: 4-(cytidine 5'-diphospho)-2-C-methyl-D-erythritol kinase [Thermomicrobiales bacterium]
MPRRDPWPAGWIATGRARIGVRRVLRAEAVAGIAAPAKLNLGLAVTGRRTDGYHKLVTLMVSLSLADTVRVESATSFSLACDDPAMVTDDNLVMRAARGWQALTGERGAARITLMKRIPVSAGLGGGSGDAAATLIALDALWSARTPDAALLDLARSLGADVPFALYGGAMVARGIGDVLTPAPVPDVWVVLVVPHIVIPRKTAALYGALAPGDFGDGAAITRQVAGLRAGKSLDPALLGNTFLAPLERIAPAVAATRAAMGAHGVVACLSGSGPTLYVPCDSEAVAHMHADHFRRSLDATVIVARTAALERGND